MDPTFNSVRSKYLAQPIAEVDAKGRPLWSMFDRSFGWLTPTILYGFSVVVFGTIVAFFVDRLFVSTWLDVGPGCGASIANCLPVARRCCCSACAKPRPISPPTSPTRTTPRSCSASPSPAPTCGACCT